MHEVATTNEECNVCMSFSSWAVDLVVTCVDPLEMDGDDNEDHFSLNYVLHDQHVHGLMLKRGTLKYKVAQSQRWPEPTELGRFFCSNWWRGQLGWQTVEEAAIIVQRNQDNSLVLTHYLLLVPLLAAGYLKWFQKFSYQLIDFSWEYLPSIIIFSYITYVYWNVPWAVNCFRFCCSYTIWGMWYAAECILHVTRSFAYPIILCSTQAKVSIHFSIKKEFASFCIKMADKS